MEKVKLPWEVADAIEFIRKAFAETSLHDLKWLEGEIDDSSTVRSAKNTILNFISKKNLDQFDPNHPLIIYHKALVNGYEIEIFRTPEEKIKVMYEASSSASFRQGVIGALAILGLKVTGVNTDE